MADTQVVIGPSGGVKRKARQIGQGSAIKRRAVMEEKDKASDEEKVQPAVLEPKGASTHVRFGSEEVLDPAPIQDSPVETLEIIAGGDEEEDSDDEAPEDVAATDAEAVAKQAETRATHAAEEQQSRAKQSRRELNERLQAQAKVSSRKKTEAKSVLPDLLPDELLTDEVLERAPTPEPIKHVPVSESASNPINQKLRFEDKKLRDTNVGPMKVRILEKVNSFLPPKANKQSKSIKDAWLSGRRGKFVVERRDVNKRFLSQ